MLWINVAGNNQCTVTPCHYWWTPAKVTLGYRNYYSASHHFAMVKSDGQASRTGAKMVNDVGVVWQRLYDCCEWVMTWWHHNPYISMFISYCHKSDQSILSCVQECWMLIIFRQEPGHEMVCLPSLTIYEAIWRQFFQKWSHLYLQLRLL